MGSTPGSQAHLSFGRYETLFRIGMGGMAEVFAARLRGEAGFERLVAIKRLLPHLSANPLYVARFLDEGRLAARVVHPHVVQTLDLGRTDEGEPFLVLELVVGASLQRLVRRELRPPIPVLVSWLIQAAEGLHAAHIARAPDASPLGLVHRDVSPHNILIGVDGNARIGDFGVAHAALLKSAHTPTGHVSGKLAYFSPEQANGGPPDARSDVFALGIVAWEALTGQRLFGAAHPVHVIDRVRSLDVVPPHRVATGIPERVSAAIMAALARELDARTASAGAFARDLAAAAQELGESPGSHARSRCVRAVLDEQWHERWRELGAASRTGSLPTHTGSTTRRRLAVPRSGWIAIGAVVSFALWAGFASEAEWRPSAQKTPATVALPERTPYVGDPFAPTLRIDSRNEPLSKAEGSGAAALAAERSLAHPLKLPNMLRRSPRAQARHRVLPSGLDTVQVPASGSENAPVETRKTGHPRTGVEEPAPALRPWGGRS